MKLATYHYEHLTSCGIITDSGIIDIPSHTQGLEKLHSVKEILIKGHKATEILRHLQDTVQERLSPHDLVTEAPIPRPNKILALAGNYKKHLEETAWQDQTHEDQATTTNPWPFIIPATAVIANNREIAWPVFSEQIDYEIELAIFIGCTTQKIRPDEAPRHIAGYSIANDISARSVTFKAGRKDRPRDVFFDWIMGKWSDGFLPLGPCLVTADEIGDPQKLALELKVNGEVRQKANTSEMIFSVYDIVSFISHLMVLEPGDIIITGTPAGVASADGRYLQAGDVIECTIEKIGTLTNTLGPKPKEFYKGFIA